MRSLSASEVCQVWELGQGQHPVDRALTILAFAYPEMEWDQLAELTVGEREVRLLTVREQTFGPTLAGSADCPQCAEPLGFTTSTAAIRVADPDELAKREHKLTEGGLELRFRLPNSRDLAATVVSEDVEAARRLLVERCTLEASRDGASVAPSELPPGISTKLAAHMAECDPQAEVLLRLDCPACGHKWRALFDIVAFFWAELAAQAKRLLLQVHTLARTYGWREADILSMSAPRRQFYLEMAT
jgi:hypothetical protein